MPKNGDVTVRIADVEDIATARKLLAGDTNANVGYLWHIDLASVEFINTTMEVCDGHPSDAELLFVYVQLSSLEPQLTPNELR